MYMYIYILYIYIYTYIYVCIHIYMQTRQETLQKCGPFPQRHSHILHAHLAFLRCIDCMLTRPIFTRFVRLTRVWRVGGRDRCYNYMHNYLHTPSRCSRSAPSSLSSKHGRVRPPSCPLQAQRPKDSQYWTTLHEPHLNKTPYKI